MNYLKSVVLILFFMGCMKNENTFERLDGSVVEVDSVDKEVQRLMNEANVTGLALTVFDDSEPVYQQTFGYRIKSENRMFEDSTNIYGASLSKAVFGYIVAHLVNDGVLDLDTPLQDYLDTPIPELQFNREWKEYTNLKDDLRYKNITARMCLNHSTGFPNWRWISREGEFTPEGDIEIYFDPGTDYFYSGEGIRLLQVVVEDITGKGLEELAQEIVFAPLKMQNTSYVWQERFWDNYSVGHNRAEESQEKDTEDEAGAAGSMETTPEDYTRFLHHILKLEQQDLPITELLFTPAIRIETKMQFGPQALEKTTKYDNIELSYGMGWGLLKTPYGFGAFKEGDNGIHKHYTILFPETGKGVMMLTNSENGDRIFKELLEITMRDVYTPWEWENYIPYEPEEQREK